MQLPNKKYACIVADPPWPQQMVGKFKRARQGRKANGRFFPYRLLPLEKIMAMQVGAIASESAHCWLWTTNSHLEDAFKVMRAWGFKYLNTITWIKPSGLGAWFANTTQHCLFGYKGKCVFPRERYRPTHFLATPKRHSEKPEEFYQLVRSISEPPRIDLFNRRFIKGFEGWGDETPKVRRMMQTSDALSKIR